MTDDLTPDLVRYPDENDKLQEGRRWWGKLGDSERMGFLKFYHISSLPPLNTDPPPYTSDLTADVTINCPSETKVSLTTAWVFTDSAKGTSGIS